MLQLEVLPKRLSQDYATATKYTPLQTTLWMQPPYAIRRLQPDEAHRYLGIYLTMDGNYKQELTTYNNQQQIYVKLLTNCPFPHREINMIYKQCYLPMVGYPLPATVTPPQPNSTKINGLPLLHSWPKWGIHAACHRQSHMPQKNVAELAYTFAAPTKACTRFSSYSNTPGQKIASAKCTTSSSNIIN